MKTNPIMVNHKRKLHKINIASLSVLSWIEDKARSKLFVQYGSNLILIEYSRSRLRTQGSNVYMTRK